MTVQPTISQSHHTVKPGYVDAGCHDLDLERFFPAGATHVSLAVGEMAAANTRTHDRSQARRMVIDTNRFHRKFGWEAPLNEPALRGIGHYTIGCLRRWFDWGDAADRLLVVGLELSKTKIPVNPESRYAYDELLHTDGTNPLRRVVQGIWSSYLGTMVALKPCFIGEGSESLRHSPDMEHQSEPTNVLLSRWSGRFQPQVTPARHLLLFPANMLPHGRPNLADLPANAPPYRYFLRMYAEPNWRYGEQLPAAMQLGEQQRQRLYMTGQGRM